MGLEILEEFRRIKPIRTGTSRAFRQRTEQQSDPAATNSKEEEEEEEEECHTPTSPSQRLRSSTRPLVCPPPPKKPRVARITTRPNLMIAPSSSFQSQGGFFQVPHDLASLFLLRQHQPSPSPSPKPPTFPTTPPDHEAALC